MIDLRSDGYYLTPSGSLYDIGAILIPFSQWQYVNLRWFGMLKYLEKGGDPAFWGS